MSDAPEYEVRCYRVVWSVKIGTIGDSEGRSWAKDLISQADFPTEEAAERHRDHHPDLFKDHWGEWRTKNCYGQFGIFREERPIADTHRAEVEAAVKRAIEACAQEVWCDFEELDAQYWGFTDIDSDRKEKADVVRALASDPAALAAIVKGPRE